MTGYQQENFGFRRAECINYISIIGFHLAIDVPVNFTNLLSRSIQSLKMCIHVMPSHSTLDALFTAGKTSGSFSVAHSIGGNFPATEQQLLDWVEMAELKLLKKNRYFRKRLRVSLRSCLVVVYECVCMPKEIGSFPFPIQSSYVQALVLDN